MADDARLNKRDQEDASRAPRAMEDRPMTENRELTEDERLEQWQKQFTQDALPDLPKIPGYHTCWLTTTNPRDNIPNRMRVGYMPIVPADVPGWEYLTAKSGETPGMISVNEMVAFKIRESLYQRYMELVHHNMPMSEDEKLTSVLDSIAERASSKGGKLMEASGQRALRAQKPAPPRETWGSGIDPRRGPAIFAG